MTEFFKIFGLLLLAGSKFAFSSPANRLVGYSYFECIIIMLVGSFTGTLFFYLLGGLLMEKWAKFRNKKEPSKTFSRQARFIVRIRRDFGLIGIAFVTPCLLSIPIGSLIAARYYRNNPHTITYLLLSCVFWTFVMSGLVYIFDVEVG